jgi:copper homeostasis protein CutC
MAVELGAARILTSGGGKCALEGIEGLRQLIGRPDIGPNRVCAAAGIESHNIKSLLQQVPALRQVHGSFRGPPLQNSGALLPGGHAERRCCDAQALEGILSVLGGSMAVGT